MSVCVVNSSERSVSLLICKLLWGSRRQKRSLTKDAAPTLFSFTKLAVPRVLSERRAKVLKRNRLVESHTDSLLILNIEINIIRPDLN